MSRTTRIAAGALVVAGAGLTVTGVANAVSVPSGTVSAAAPGEDGGPSASAGTPLSVLPSLLEPSKDATGSASPSASPTGSAPASPSAPASGTPAAVPSGSAAASGGAAVEPVMRQSPPSQRLAETGGGVGTPLLASGAAALVAGGLVFRFGPRRRQG